MTTLNGLCLSCAYAGECALKNHSRSGIQFCEEYKTAAPLASVGPSGMAAAPIKNSVPRLKGLCGNCSRYEDCGFRKPETGVWHCEEYR